MSGMLEINSRSHDESGCQGFVVIVSGSSGAGKGTIIERMRELRDDFVLSISTTTRKPRVEGAVGEHYQHVSEAEFHQLVSEGAFLEWADVHGHLYGTRKVWVEEKVREGWIVVLEIDVQGALQVMQRKVDNASVFVTPSDRNVAHERLRARGTETEEDIERRIRNSGWEYAQMNQFDYIVINDSGKLEEAAQTLSAILTAERARMGRCNIRP
jgi:guanylate kinase